MTDITKVTIAAVDQASEVIARVRTSFERLQGAYMKLLQLGTLGLGADYFVDLVKGAIDAQAHLDDLSKATSIAVEQLAGLKLAAQVSGTNLDNVASSINKLAQNVGKNAEAFHALGISTKDPLEAFLQLADVLSNIQDPTLRAAVASQALGKSWQEVAPLLNQGSARIRALIDEGTKLSNITSASAAAANELNKHWQELVGTGGLLNTVINKMVPLLNLLVEAAIKFRNSGFVEYLEKGAKSLLPAPLQGMLTILQAVAIAAQKASDGSKQLLGDMAMWANAGDQVSRKAASDAAAAARAYLASAQAAADAAKLQAFYEQAVAKARSDMAIADAEAANGAARLTQAERELLTIHQNPLWAQLSAKAKEEIDNDFKKAAAKQMLVQITEAQLAAQQALDQEDADTMAQVQEIMNRGKDRLDQANATVQSYKDEIAVLGLNDGARQQVLLGLQKEKALRGVLNPETRQGIENAYAEAQALAQQYVQLQQQLSVWDDLGNKAGQFFSDLVEHGRGAFNDLKNMVRQFFAEVAADFAKRWILQLGASMVGGVAGQALGAQAGGVGQGSAAGGAMNLISQGGSLLGGSLGIMGSTGLLSTLGGAIGGSFGAGLTFTGSAGLAEGAAAALSGTGTAAFSLGAIIPVIGWIVAIGALLYSIFGSKGGGPKQQGFYSGLFSPGANTYISSMSNDGLFTGDNQHQSDARNLGVQVGQGIAQTIQALGGTPGSLGIGVGYSMDPQGTAPSMFHGLIRDAQGNELFRYQNDNLSRDPQQFQQEVQAAISRLVVGALQNDKTIPPAIQRWVHTIDAATASDADIQRILQGAAAIKSLYGEMDGLTAAIAELNDPTGVTAVTDSLKALDKSVTDAKKALDAAASAGDPQQFLQAEQAYKQAVLNRYQQEIAMVRQLQDAIRQTQAAAYQFAVDIAGKINAAGGNIDIAAIAMGRATSLQSGIGAPNPIARNPAAPIATQIQDLQSYVGAIDTWYQARRQAILDDAQKQADAINAANQARLAQLNAELAVVNSMKQLIDQAAQMAKSMQLSTDNPLSAFGRLDIATSDVDQLRAAFQAATGADKATIGQQLLQALQSEQGLAGSTLQRPSDAYQAVYNQIQRDLALIGKDAQSIGQQQLDLTKQIADASGTTASATTIAQGELNALDAQARGYYTWAQGEGARLYALQQTAYQQQLEAITGGSDPELWIAEKSTEMRDLLKSIDAQIGAFLDAIGGSTDTTTPSSGGTDTGNPIARGGTNSVPKVVVIHTSLTGDQVVTALKSGGAPARRLLGLS